MSRPRSFLLVAATVAVLLAVSGCGGGFEATARQSYAPGDGIQAGSGDLQVLSALVVGADDGSGVVLMAVVNRGAEAEEIVSVESDGGTVDYTGSREVPAGETLRFGAGSDPSATIGNLSAEPGEAITLDVRFDAAEPITLRTVVVPATGDYAEVTLPAEPTPTPTAPPTASPTTS